MSNKNLLMGRPVTWGDREQYLLKEATTPCSIYDPRPGSPFFSITCICCAQGITIRKRYDAIEEKMRFVTPRVHSCLCGARILLYRFNSDGSGRMFNNGEVVYRHLGAYEVVNELAHAHRHDSWKFYRLYPIKGENDDFSRQNTLGL